MLVNGSGLKGERENKPLNGLMSLLKLSTKFTPMELINQWTKTASTRLKGRHIIDARYLTEEEVKAMGWTGSCLCISLGTKQIDGRIASPLFLYASNGEGNDAGFVMSSGDENEYFPIIELGEEDE